MRTESLYGTNLFLFLAVPCSAKAEMTRPRVVRDLSSTQKQKKELLQPHILTLSFFKCVHTLDVQIKYILSVQLKYVLSMYESTLLKN